jgi:peptidoglycan hydrolase-like protein with peptidoglycan-binding domain
LATYARDIRSIQKIVGAYVDGIYGNATKASVLTYQKNTLKIYADGIWGPATEKAYLAYIAPKPPVTPPPAPKPTVDPALVSAALTATQKANARQLTSIFQIVGHTGSWNEDAYLKVKAFQTKIGTVSDGIWGLVTEITYVHDLAEKRAIADGVSVALVPVVDVARACKAKGFSGTGLVDAVSVAIAESGVYSSKTDEWKCDPIARFVNLGNPRSIDRGVFQINDYFHPDVTDDEADTPLTAAGEAYRISKGGTDFSPWATWNSGAAAKRKAIAAAAVAQL